MDDDSEDQGMCACLLGEQDCFMEPCCLCASCQDLTCCQLQPCMILRTNEVVRLIMAVVLACVVGSLVSLARPEKPLERSCVFTVPNSKNIIKAIPSSVNDNCMDLGYVDLQIQNYDFQNFKKKIPVCFDKITQSDTEIEFDKTGCKLTYELNASQVGDKIYCYGTIKKGKTSYGIISRNEDVHCKKFGLFGKNAVLQDIIYTKSFMKFTKALSSNQLKVSTGALTLKWGNEGYGINHCKTSKGGCSGKIFSVSLLKEHSNKSNVEKQKEYTKAKQDYDDLIYYLFKFPGTLWIKGLKLVIMPLLIASIITSVAALKELPGSGKLGCATFFYYLLTTLFAAIESLILCGVFLVPFLENLEMTGSSENAPKRAYADSGQQLVGVIHAIIPTNGVRAMFENNFLGVIFFSIVAGGSITNPKDSTFLRWFQELNEVMFKIIYVLIQMAPLGVFWMTVYLLAFNDFGETAAKAGLFLASIFTGLFLHIFVVYPCIYVAFTRKNPYKFLYNVSEAACFALAIASSMVTLPLTLKCAIEKNKISREIAHFVCTLGATVNMDGTTIGFPISIVFCAFGQGIKLTFGEMIVIVILSTVSSMGAAPIPSAGLVLLIVMLDNLDIPLEGPFTIVMATDWIYDRPETMTNIIGDSFAAGVLDHFLEQYQPTPAEEENQGQLVRKFSGRLSDQNINASEA